MQKRLICFIGSKVWSMHDPEFKTKLYTAVKELSSTKEKKMKTIIKKALIIPTIALFVGSSLLFGGAVSSDNKLINIAGKQRMLSQRIAKNYFYIGKKINVSKAKKQLKESLDLFGKNLSLLKRSLDDEEIQNMIMFIEMSSEDFDSIATTKYSLDNGAIALDLSESMLEGSQFVVSAIKKLNNTQSSNIIDIAGRQRMLSQRIAKYYISYQSGIKDKNSIDQMKETVKLFSDTHKKLLANKTNSAEINAALKKVDRLWKIVYKFYLKIEKGGLPIIVYNTTDDIMKHMNKITNMYTELYK